MVCELVKLVRGAATTVKRNNEVFDEKTDGYNVANGSERHWHGASECSALVTPFANIQKVFHLKWSVGRCPGCLAVACATGRSGCMAN